MSENATDGALNNLDAKAAKDLGKSPGLAYLGCACKRKHPPITAWHGCSERAGRPDPKT